MCIRVEGFGASRAGSFRVLGLSFWGLGLT